MLRIWLRPTRGVWRRGRYNHRRREKLRRRPRCCFLYERRAQSHSGRDRRRRHVRWAVSHCVKHKRRARAPSSSRNRHSHVPLRSVTAVPLRVCALSTEKTMTAMRCAVFSTKCGRSDGGLVAKRRSTYTLAVKPRTHARRVRHWHSAFTTSGPLYTAPRGRPDYNTSCYTHSS